MREKVTPGGERKLVDIGGTVFDVTDAGVLDFSIKDACQDVAEPEEGAYYEPQ